MQSTIKTTMLITAVAGMFGCAGTTPPAATAPTGHASNGVKCAGINECKGHGECATAGHPCGKHTPCKGQGYLTVASAGECSTRGGTVL